MISERGALWKASLLNTAQPLGAPRGRLWRAVPPADRGQAQASTSPQRRQPSLDRVDAWRAVEERLHNISQSKRLDWLGNWSLRAVVPPAPRITYVARATLTHSHYSWRGGKTPHPVRVALRASSSEEVPSKRFSRRKASRERFPMSVPSGRCTWVKGASVRQTSASHAFDGWWTGAQPSPTQSWAAGTPAITRSSARRPSGDRASERSRPATATAT